MSERRIRTYVAIMIAGAVVCLWATDWTTLTGLPRDGLIGLAGLIAIALFSESLAIGLSVGGGSSSITFLPLLASVQLFGPAAGIALIVPTIAFAEFVVRRKAPTRGAFNISLAVVATTAGGALFKLLGGHALHGLDDPQITRQLGPFIAFGLVSLAVNHAGVSLAITYSQGLPFRRVFDRVLSNSGARLNDILISPIALAVAFLYVQFGIGGILVILLPMLFIRYSYLTTSKLRESNEDLLTALVKAIEIRDPYTSGHSQRVSLLAGQIAEELGLNRLVVERIKMAALLHDIGKIEAVYLDILRKPDSLTDVERSVIESHVTKGEELLRGLASVPEDVVRAVRHHHEREDGAGYPDGLVGSEIPIGAKIIVACDSIDAMLSDRPYRRALPLAVVLDQLSEHSGEQFDRKVVHLLLRSDILPQYAETMRLHREQTSVHAVDHAKVVPLPVPSMIAPPVTRLRSYQ
jgi:putative nucleotidyltransferase with HDIG domain